MKKNVIKWSVVGAVLLVAIIVVVMTCCSVENIDKEKIRDMEYEVVDEEYIPEEIYEKLMVDKDEFCRKAYVCSDKLYIVVCYGEQPTDGYSIEVNQLYESSNAIIVETTLKGPLRQDKVEEVISYPYVVLLVEYVDKTVVFN